MLGKTILLYTDDRGAARTLTGHLRGAGSEVLVAEGAANACDLIGARAVDLVLVDGGAPSALSVLEAARGRAPSVVMSARGEPQVMLDFVCDRGAEHFLASDQGSLDQLAREVVVTAEKILRADLFGIEKYLPSFGVELSSTEVKSAHDRDAVVEHISSHVEWLGAGRETRRAVAAIVDELVTNAVYDAPRDASGRARYHGTDRRVKVQLDPWEYVSVRWGSDGEVLAISVTDMFGALSPEHVRAGLRRCLTADDPIEQKAGGAGLGLYTALAHAQQLIVNVDRGVKTEMIAIVDLRRRGAAARRTGRSLHLFCQDARVVETSDATPTTIAISDSMLVDLRDALAPQKHKTEVVPLVTPKRAPGPVRARGTEAPPSADPIGAGTACGLLRGAATAETAIAIALRFLTHHFEAAIAYSVAGNQLDAASAAGRVRDWARLRELHLSREDTASVVALAGRGVASLFEPARPIDYKLALLATGDSEAAGMIVPLHVAGELRWILYAARPRETAAATPATVEEVRQELERNLTRLDPDEPEIEVAITRG